MKPSELRRLAREAEQTFRALNYALAHVPVKVELRISGRRVVVPLDLKKLRVRDPRYELRVWFVEGELIYGAIRRRDHAKLGFPWVLHSWRLDGRYLRVWTKRHDWDLVERP